MTDRPSHTRESIQHPQIKVQIRIPFWVREWAWTVVLLLFAVGLWGAVQFLPGE